MAETVGRTQTGDTRCPRRAQTPGPGLLWMLEFPGPGGGVPEARAQQGRGVRQAGKSVSATGPTAALDLGAGTAPTQPAACWSHGVQGPGRRQGRPHARAAGDFCPLAVQPRDEGKGDGEPGPAWGKFSQEKFPGPRHRNARGRGPARRLCGMGNGVARPDAGATAPPLVLLCPPTWPPPREPQPGAH